MTEARPEIVIITTLIIIAALAIYYLVIANTYGNKYQGVLVKVNVNGKSDCNKNDKCTTHYYIREVFEYEKTNNITDVCFVDRLTTYYLKSDADYKAWHTKLGTTRTIWTTYYNSKICYDETLKLYYNTIGYTLVAFSGLMMLIAILLIMIATISPTK
jgi:hypothetical protein